MAKRNFKKVIKRSSMETHFQDIPLESKPRSRWKTRPQISDSFNCGEVVPIYWFSVVPGDTFKVDIGSVIRSQPLISPIFANFVVDFNSFFIPWRLVFDHTKEFFGENRQGAYDENETIYSLPKIVPPADGWQLGTVAEKMDYPYNKAGDTNKYNAIPLKSYALVCDEYFRNENIMNPINISKGDADVQGSNGDDYVTDLEKGGKLYKACKLSDYFTVALPKPQKGESVKLPLGNDAPVYFDNNHSNYLGKKRGASDLANFAFAGGVGSVWETKTNVAIKSDNAGHMAGQDSTLGAPYYAVIDNAFADMSGATGTDIIQLRKAFQMQRYLELDSHYGTRYFEFIKGHFGVNSPDATIQRPQYLGGHRVLLSPEQVVSTVGTQDAPQGNMAGYLLSSDVAHEFTNSFTEFGTVIITCTIRYHHSYPQGVPRELLKSNKFDIYDPLFNGIGDQEIFNAEIFCQGNDQDKEIFGYTERYGEYRVFPSRVRGQMRPQVTAGFSHWNLSDNYNSLPHLSEEWIVEDSNNIKRIFSITDEEMTNQFFADFTFDITATRTMPIYSTPGRIDHAF